MAIHDGYMDRELSVEPTGNGPLNGLVFAVKDVFDIKGHISSAGHPDWKKSHGPAERTARALERLLHNGARLEGTTVTDELMYSLQGENHYYGTPVNPNAPGRAPGGSSSGSAAVTAAGLADFAVGTDTGGSVRIPASYCGLFGFRPSHGAVSAEGVIPLAPGFDTVGWMSKDAWTLLQVGRVLLDQPVAAADAHTITSFKEAPGAGATPSSKQGEPPFRRVYWAADAWELAEEPSRKRLEKQAAGLLGGLVPSRIRLAGPEGGLAAWAELFRQLQGREIWRGHGEWVRAVKPAFGPGIAERFAWASALPEDGGSLRAEQRRIAALLGELLGDDGLLVIPTAPGEAPPLRQAGEAADRQRARTMQLTCIAGLAGLPQATVPRLSTEGCPVGLSFLAGRGRDLRLLEWIYSLQDQHPSGEGACE